MRDQRTRPCDHHLPPAPGTRSWTHLERNLLITFNFESTSVPAANTSNLSPDKLSGLFQYRRLVKVLRARG